MRHGGDVTFKRDDRISIFGALRPRDGQTASRAIISTYSLDLIAMLGLVLALGGDAEAEFETSPLGLVQAFERVRGRLVVLHQLGRVLAPCAHRSILPLLDTMVCAIPSNEREASWHAKIALVRYEAAEGVEWRFWIGSRNLTGSTDLDAGLLLVTSKTRSAQPLRDIGDLAEDLLSEAKISPGDLAELRMARWLAPAGVRVRSLLWRGHGQIRRFLATPMIPRAEKGCAVGPFIDSGGLGEVLKAGAGGIALLTTREACAGSAPFDGVSFRIDTPPEPEAPVSVEQQQEGNGEFIEPPSTGIHAKLLAVTKGERTALMLGSANLTRRGLIGPNAEAVALLEVTDPALAKSLYDFAESGLELDVTEPDAELVEKERSERQLDDLISEFLERRLTLSYEHDGLLLMLGGGADDVLTRARFEVAPFLDADGWTKIERGKSSIRLLTRPVALSEQTSLVTFRARTTTVPEVCRTWVQALDADGLDDERRDRALLARYVGASRFRDWLRSLLDGVDGTGGQRWSGVRSQVERSDSIGQLAEMFTLETMLAAWARDHKAFESRVAGMMAMLDSFQETFEFIADEEERRAALLELAEVRPFLQAVDDAISGGVQ